MKAMFVQQPFAYEILSGQRTIDVREEDALQRGDVLVCSSPKAAFSEDLMEDMELEYGCSFLYGYALFTARLSDVRLMKKGDEDPALLDAIDPEAYSWVFEDVRPVIPFPVKTKKPIAFFDVNDDLINLSPFRYDESVEVKPGVLAEEYGIDFSGWRGRAAEIIPLEDDDEEIRIHVIWDSVCLRAMPISMIEQCEKEGIDWTGVLLRLNEIEPTKARDTWDDVEDAIESIIDGNPAIFEVSEDLEEE